MKTLNIVKNPIFEESISISSYFNDIKKLKQTSKEEEEELGKKILEGCSKSCDELIKRNIKLVITIAKQYQGHNVELEDLIAEGNRGLIEAAKIFDYRLGNKFSSFAFPWIRQYIMMAINSNSRVIRVPVNKLNAYNKLQAFKDKFFQSNQREPSPEEINKYLKIKEDDLLSLSSINDHISIDNSFNNEEESNLENDIEQISEDNTDSLILSNEIKVTIQNILKNDLNSDQVQFISLKFGINCNSESIQSICRIMKISKSKAMELEKQIINILTKNKKLKIIFKEL